MDAILWFITCVALLQMTSAEPEITVEPRVAIIGEGDNLTAMCSVKQSIFGCAWKQASDDEYLDVEPESNLPKRMKYFGRGLEYGECGITIFIVTKKHMNTYSCRINVSNQMLHEYVTVFILPTYRTDYHMNVTEIDPVDDRYPNNTFEENKRILAECTFKRVFGDAYIYWFIGNERIEDGLRRNEIEVEDRNSKSQVTRNVTRNLTYSDNGKHLICVLRNYFESQDRFYSNFRLFTLNVYFPPKFKKTEQSAFRIGHPGEIIVIIDANPKPTIKWLVDGEKITERNTDATGKYYAFNLIPRGKHTWEAVSRIENVETNDEIKNYTFTAESIAGDIKIGLVIPVCQATFANSTTCLPLSHDSDDSPKCFSDSTTCTTPPAETTTHSSSSPDLTSCPKCSADVTAWSIAGVVSAILIILIIFGCSKLTQRRRSQYVKRIKGLHGWIYSKYGFKRTKPTTE